MSLIGHHTLNPTTDPTELATRETCATEGHQPLTFNPWIGADGATWCRCGALVVAGNQVPEPVWTPRVREPSGMFSQTWMPCAGCGADSGEECFPGCMSYEESA